MNLIETSLIAFALSLDAAAVTMADSIAYHRTKNIKLVKLPAVFALFQGIMPLLGFFLMTCFQIQLGIFSNVFVFLILAFIGIRMIFNVFRPEKNKLKPNSELSFSVVIIQAVCTSVDAFVVGIGFGAISGISIFIECIIIAAITFAVCMAFLMFGRKISLSFGSKAELVGGLLIIAVGIKNLF